MNSEQLFKSKSYKFSSREAPKQYACSTGGAREKDRLEMVNKVKISQKYYFIWISDSLGFSYFT